MCVCVCVTDTFVIRQQYNFWQRPGGDLLGEPKSDASADFEIHVTMVPRKRVAATGAEGVCARITRRRRVRPSTDAPAAGGDDADVNTSGGGAGGRGKLRGSSVLPETVGAVVDDDDDDDDEMKEMLLLSLQYAPIDTPLFSVARQLSRIEGASTCHRAA
jgi:hypothetical protein